MRSSFPEMVPLPASNFGRSDGTRDETYEAREMQMRPACLVAAVFGLLIPFGGSAQVVVRVIDDYSDLPIPEALVQLLDADGNVLDGVQTGADGVARVGRGEEGSMIRVQSLGFRSVDVPATDSVAVVRLAALPLELEGLNAEVEGRSGISQFSRRRARGAGIFLDPADVKLTARHDVRDVFRDLDKVRRTNWSFRGPKIVSGLGSGCFNYRLNNLPVRPGSGGNPWDAWPLETLRPRDVMAVEVYRYFGEVSEELRHNGAVGGGLCGLIVIWTREAWWDGS